jgi:hypothetical protein
MADIINQEALYRAGAASVTRGGNAKAEAHNASMDFFTRTVGSFLENQVTQQIAEKRALKVRNRSLVNDAFEKYDASDIGLNASMQQSVKHIHSEYNRYLGMGKKGEEGARNMLRQLKEIQKYSSLTKSNLESITAKAAGMSGTSKGNQTIQANPGNSHHENLNILELANGSLLELMRWDPLANGGKGGMYVIRNGEWRTTKGKDGTSKKEYYQLGGTDDNGNVAMSNTLATTATSYAEDQALNGAGILGGNWVEFDKLSFGLNRDTTIAEGINKQLSNLLLNTSNEAFGLNWDAGGEGRIRGEIYAIFNDSSLSADQLSTYFFEGLINEFSGTGINGTSPAHQWITENDITTDSNGKIIVTPDADGKLSETEYNNELEALKKYFRDHAGTGTLEGNAINNKMAKYASDYLIKKYTEGRAIADAARIIKTDGSSMTYAQGLAKHNLETAVSNINSTYTEILKDDKTDDKGKRIDSGKQGTYVKLNKDKSGKWLWYGYVNNKLPDEEKDVQTWPMGTGGKPDPSMVNWLTNSQVMSVSSGFDPNDY